MPQSSDALKLVSSFDPGYDPQLKRSRERTIELLKGSAEVFDRTHYQPGHLTASGIVLSPDAASVLLVFHRRFQRWLQPGGHVERADLDVAAAARREIREETGVVVRTDLLPALVSIDVHNIPAAEREPEHQHFDLVFRFKAARSARDSGPGKRDVLWCRVDEVAGKGGDASLLAGLKRAMRVPE